MLFGNARGRQHGPERKTEERGLSVKVPENDLLGLS